MKGDVDAIDVAKFREAAKKFMSNEDSFDLASAERLAKGLDRQYFLRYVEV